MTLPLPNLDDRRWDELVEEGRALIPAYSPDWTDHNVHDPGITFIELLAWVAEQDIYRLNRIGDAHLRRFLALADSRQRSPQPARAVVTFREKHYRNRNLHGVLVPKQTELAGQTLEGADVRFQTIDDVTIVATRLESVFVRGAYGTRDLTEQVLDRDTPFLPFGDDPQAGNTLHLGLDPIGGNEAEIDLRIYFAVDELCPEPREHCSGSDGQNGPVASPREHAPCGEHNARHQTPMVDHSHHSASVQWEFFAGHGQSPGSPWKAASVVEDSTAALSRSGFVVLRLSLSDLASTRLARNASQLHYLRCRLIDTRFDTAPEILSVHCNAVEVEQSIESGSLAEASWTVALAMGLPHKGQSSTQASCRELQQISRLARKSLRHRFLPDAAMEDGCLTLPGAPGRIEPFHVEPVADRPNWIRVHSDLVQVGIGNGRPLQQLRLPRAPVACGSLRLFVHEPWPRRWSLWDAKKDLLSSSRTDRHFALDEQTGEITFGDGERGRVVPDGGIILAAWKATEGGAGNLPRGGIASLVDSPRNRWRLPELEQLRTFGVIGQPRRATGGSDAESIDQAQSRAFRQATQSPRAVTLEDYEQLALQSPGVCLARAKALANVHPAFPCVRADGVVTLIVLPSLPSTRPMPSAGLLHRVKEHLYPRRILGTRVEVVGPEYVLISVRAQVRGRQGADPARLADEVATAIDDFLHPLHGGSNQSGWPFGRNVYRSEILHVIDQTPGVDHVLSLEFLDDQGRETCGNVCVPELALVDAQSHQINVERWQA